MKRVFIIHGWDGYPEEGWFPWLKKQLENKGIQVRVLAMPNPSEPMPGSWVPYLAKEVGVPDGDTYFVGHSMGCQTILRFLAGLPTTTKVGGVVCVAGFYKLQNMSPAEEKIRSAWLDDPFDTARVQKICPKIMAIFSPTDRWVPLTENEEWFKEELGAKTLVVDGKGEKGHFSGSDGVVELPEALEAVLEMSK